jgi:radical SAM protein with 4Fe4S-binding SPASM domain
MVDFNKVYSVNEDYILRHDKYRSFIISRELILNDGSSNWSSIIHPEQAKIFSFFTHGLSLRHSVKNLSEYLRLSFDECFKLVKPYLNNENEFHTHLNGTKFEIPRKLLINSNQTYRKFTVEDFSYETLDFATKRMFVAPTSITLMLSNSCVTDCIYCYADIHQNVSSAVSLDKIRRLVKDASELDIVDFDIIGGEIFLFKYWREVLLELKKYGYYPEMISTKKPLNENEIDFLKKVGINRIQLSFDSLDKNILSKLLNNPVSYKQNFIDSLKILTKKNFEIQIAITLTKINSNINAIEELLNFISTFPSISTVDIGPAFYSLYKKDFFSNQGISKDKFISISNHIIAIKDSYNFSINIDNSYTERGFYSCSSGSMNFPGGECSANRDHMFVLPDGKVTICEQLYWNEKFIVGDINNSSIIDIWNSPKSIFLANLQRSDFSSGSKCKNCNIFEKCHVNVNKCWADILKAYGNENWDFPDPRCSYAPQMHNRISF